MPRSSENIQSESQYISNCQLKRDCQLHWYAVRVTYSRELSLKDYLDKADLENFIPMHYEYIMRNERRVRKLVPAIHNLVFIRSTRACIDEIKNNYALNIPAVSYTHLRAHET